MTRIDFKKQYMSKIDTEGLIPESDEVFVSLHPKFAWVYDKLQLHNWAES